MESTQKIGTDEVAAAQAEPRLKVHVLGWKGDRAVTHEDIRNAANVQLYVRAFIDDVEIPNVMRVRTYHAREFGHQTITVCLPVDIVEHTQESWEALGK